jgi:phospholipase/carboxylesterase
MTSEPLRALVIGPEDGATHAIIWLHGLGDTGFGHEDVVRALELPESSHVRFILPHAPSRPVTVNMGMVMPAWYDIASIGGGGSVDQDGIQESAAAVGRLVEREVDRGVPTERIFLAGFSQGGVIALYLAFRHPDRLAGVLGLSTYLVGDDTLEKETAAANRSLPVFLGHGTDDPMVPFASLDRTRVRLASLGHRVTARSYPMGHAVCVEEIRDVGTWLSDLLV